MLSWKHRSRSRESRGVVAIVTGLSVLFVVTFSILMAELGLASLQRYEMHDAAEAMAMAESYQVMTQPSTGSGGGHQGGAIPANPLGTDNARAGTLGSLQVKPHAIPVYPGPTLAWNDAAGSGYEVTSTNPASYISTVAAPLAVGGNARVAVNQYQVIDMVPIPARIMLIMDYSRSMRLPYPGGGLAAKTLLQNAVNNIITDPKLNNRVDWAYVLFADSIGANSAPLGPPTVYSPAAVANHKVDITNNVNGPTFGNGTDLASAITLGASLLTGGGYSYGDINYGKNVMIIITDGEPDVDPAQGPNAAYNSLVAAATLKAKNAVEASWSQGIQTITILIKRETTLGATDDQLFMESIAGDGKPGLPGTQIATNAGVADYAGGLGAFLNMINPANHCISDVSISPPPSSWMPAPDPNGSIYGFWVPSGTNTYVETLVPRYSNNRNMDPPPNPTSGDYRQDRPAFFYDTKTGKVELNVSICMNYLQNPGARPTFRARYGLPRIASTGSM